MREMDVLFNAKSVAVVGFSDRPGNAAQTAYTNMSHFGYKDQVFFVGRSGGTYDGHTVYQDIDDLPGPVDVALLTVPRDSALEAVEKCGRKGIPWVVMYTAGFSEFSDKFANVENEIRATLRRYGMHLVGPNGIGIFNYVNGFAGAFMPWADLTMRPGPVSIVAQSGTVTGLLAEGISQYGPGVNKFISVGNKLDVDEVDYLSYLAEDPSTEVICMYLEGFKRGEAFIEAARRCKKPILIFKNAGDASTAMAKSHTAALASDDRVVDAALRSAGVIRCSSVRQMALLSGAIRLPLVKGNRIVVASHSGGSAVLAADKAEKNGFKFVKIDEKVIEQVTNSMKAVFINLSNPLDLGGAPQPEVIFGILPKLLDQPDVDAVVTVLSKWMLPWPGDPLADAIANLKKHANKPCLISFMNRIPDLVDVSRQYDYPMIEDAEEAVVILGRMRDYAKLKEERERFGSEDTSLKVDKAAAVNALKAASSDGRRELGLESAPIFAAYGLPVIVPRLAKNAADAKDIVASLGVPVAMKIHSQDVLHKSDAGGIRLNVQDGPEAARAFDEIVESVLKHVPNARIEGIDIQPMVGEGREVIVGAKRDPQFGPMVLFGLGGIYAELMNEVSLRIAPVTKGEALAMIDETKAGKLLSGVRGEAAADKEALAEVIARLSLLMRDVPEIVEVDLNPVKVLKAGSGCQMVDARMILKA